MIEQPVVLTGNNRRHFIKGVVLGTMGFCTSRAVCAAGSSREWLEVVELDLPRRDLPAPFVGCRLVHVSDLHYSRTVSRAYLRRCVERINSLEADIVVLTGDYITHDARGQFRRRVAKLLGDIESRLGVFACLGNHDYGLVYRWQSRFDGSPQGLIDQMRAQGIKTLRNQAYPVEACGHRLWMVGLGDWWAEDFDPPRAFADVPDDESAIVLMHNPRGIKHLDGFPVYAAMCGHTHGRSTKLPGPKLPPNRRRYGAGMFEVNGTPMYVNRGLGRHGRLQFRSRPEITVFNLGTA